ncbi:MAG: hypothetical protein AABP62_13165 [Planctomycetota bacterium]
MPIKFRCNYCRQFLGISRAQAGGVVDCPTCGRSIRVPLLDGTVQPLPTPELNLQDAHLARALDELANLGDMLDQPLHAVRSDSHEAVDDDDDENEIPQLIPEPIPIEVPIAPTPIKISPPAQALESVPDSSSVTPGQSVPNSHDAAGSPNGPAAGREQRLFDELASLTPPDAPAATPSGPQREVEASDLPRADTRVLRSRPSAARTTFAVLVLFVGGMFVERFARIIESLNPSAPSSAESPAPVAAVSGDVTGRITFKSAEGESQPDRGARLIVFPTERTGEVKLPVTGFRPADGEADAKVAAAALKALGGALATADEQGRFHLDLPAGSYRILVLSHFQSRDESEAIDAAITRQLGDYFDKPTDLLGRVKHHFAPLRVKGTGDMWDHAF